MASVLVRKLDCYLPLSEDDRASLAAIRFECLDHAARTEINAGLVRSRAIHQIQNGYACRYRQLRDGRRQISALLIPGDFIDLRTFVLRGAEHDVFSLSALTLLAYPVGSMLDVLETRPRPAQAVWRSLLAEEAIALEWLVSLGQRSALERVAHLVCELHVRHSIMSGESCRTFMLPVTQREVGDAMGLSSVHVNRTVKELRQRNLALVQSGEVRILDFTGLADLALFSPAYLHFRNRAVGSSLESDGVAGQARHAPFTR